MRNKCLVLMFALLLCPSLSFANTWKIDNTHSSVIFKVKHLNVAWAFGMFRKIDGSLTWAK
ncbi:MAG: YceI family protein, partial [Myxococcota bacterium]